MGHLLRSKYNCILSTSASINKDNSTLNCRINGLMNYQPDILIVERNLRLKKNLNILKPLMKRKINIITKKKKIHKHLKKYKDITNSNLEKKKTLFILQKNLKWQI